MPVMESRQVSAANTHGSSTSKDPTQQRPSLSSGPCPRSHSCCQIKPASARSDPLPANPPPARGQADPSRPGTANTIAPLHMRPPALAGPKQGLRRPRRGFLFAPTWRRRTVVEAGVTRNDSRAGGPDLFVLASCAILTAAGAWEPQVCGSNDTR